MFMKNALIVISPLLLVNGGVLPKTGRGKDIPTFNTLYRNLWVGCLKSIEFLIIKSKISAIS